MFFLKYKKSPLVTVVLKVLKISLKPQLVIVISKLFLIYVRFNSICDFNIIFKILFIIITIKKIFFVIIIIKPQSHTVILQFSL